MGTRSKELFICICLLSLIGCAEREPWHTPIEIISGVVIREEYQGVEKVVGVFGKRIVADLERDVYRMVVETKDKRRFRYTFRGSVGRNMDYDYDVGSTVNNLPSRSLIYGGDRIENGFINDTRDKTGLFGVSVSRIK